MKGRGLLPVIAQDIDSGDVLMLAWADREALRRSLASGQAWYFSRSRQSYWHKGASSGHTQEIHAAATDCDSDAVLLRVKQTGPACHTGEQTCFHRPLTIADVEHLTYGPALRGSESGDQHHDAGFLEELQQIIAQRLQERPPGSYVAALAAAGPTRALQKVGEEAVEFTLAAATMEAAGRGAVIGEAADLVFHLLVALRVHEIDWAEVLTELGRRHPGGGQETSRAPGT